MPDPEPDARCETHAWPADLPRLVVGSEMGSDWFAITALPPHPDDPSGCPRLRRVFFEAPNPLEAGEEPCALTLAEARVSDEGLAAYQALLSEIDPSDWPESVGTPSADDGYQVQVVLGDASTYFDVGDPEAKAIAGIPEAIDLLAGWWEDLGACRENPHLHLGPLCEDEPGQGSFLFGDEWWRPEVEAP